MSAPCDSAVSEQIIDVNTVFGFWPWRRVDIRLERLLEQMSEHRITQACAASARGFFIDTERGNQEVLDAAATHAGIFPVGSLDVRTAPTCRDVARWYDRGLRWFRFFVAQDWSLDNLAFNALLPALAERRCVLLIPAKMGLDAIARLADRYGQPIIVLEPAFGTLAELDVLLDHPQVYADVSVLNCVDGLTWLAQHGHGGQLLFGSRAPLCCLSSASALVNDPTLPADLRRDIFSANARKLMRATA